MYINSWSQKFTYTFQNMQNVNYFTKIRGIIQNACYCLFSTDLNKIFHKKRCLHSPQKKIIVEFRKILQLPQTLWFSSIFNPCQQLMYDFEIHLFILRTTEGLIINYSRRFKRSLMLQREKHALRARGWKLFELQIRVTFGKHVSIFCSFWRAVLNEKKRYFGKIRKMYTSSFCSKVFTPWLLMHVFPSGASESVWTFWNSWLWVPQLSSVWKDGSQNHTLTVEKG